MPYLGTLKLSDFDTTIRLCMHSRGALVYKHVSIEEQMAIHLSIQRYWHFQFWAM